MHEFNPGLRSVLLYCGINLAYEQVGCVEANGACQKPEAEDCHKCVTEVQQCGNKVLDVQLHEANNGNRKDHTETKKIDIKRDIPTLSLLPW